MNLPDRIDQLYVLYWGSANTKSWMNMYTEDLMKFFFEELEKEYGIRISQHINEVKILNCNRQSMGYENNKILIERMRAYKERKCPLIVLNYNFSSYAYSIDSEYRFKEFKKAFAEVMRKQVYGK